MPIAKPNNQSVKTPLKIYEENIKDGGGTKSLARTQKQLLNLHNALIREAKIQGLAKYQVSFFSISTSRERLMPESRTLLASGRDVPHA
jgi:hypothetical protein